MPLWQEAARGEGAAVWPGAAGLIVAGFAGAAALAGGGSSCAEVVDESRTDAANIATARIPDEGVGINVTACESERERGHAADVLVKPRARPNPDYPRLSTPQDGQRIVTERDLPEVRGTSGSAWHVRKCVANR
jgi:hypothetical protein